ncbi:hypothetical protein FisN_19Lh073 [Fistulifera solaris]|uniref:CGL160/ATPI domain-containing protein n=1 Tax=Fistulifera solaris TaxID=1519565 RepID=A0A1Z5J6E6_FISSO|nr:hypothetical protein FisN_19Lh073 [Fistulifera solaris]|eukprot:GAX09577.1 hypothetical protein FisN_19Lh073 [Fistulifera solaris]
MTAIRHYWILYYLLLWAPSCLAFTLSPLLTRTSVTTHWESFRRQRVTVAAYVPQREEGSKATTVKKSLHPAIGDIVRYYDLDGGRADGQALVGKISFIQPGGKTGWLIEVTPLEDVGDGYFAEYSSQQRRGKRVLRDIDAVSPILASFVQSENAFKLPMGPNRMPKVRAETYDLDDYTGPVRNVNTDVVAQDLEMYGSIKNKIFKFVALTGAAGTVVVDFVRGTEDAAIYCAGALSSLVYLFLLSIKTDTIASPEAKMGKGISNLRFAMPLIVLVGVALYNQSRGEASPVAGKGTFDYVTAEQFGAAILGFLTYRLPLFAVQLQEAFADTTNNKNDPGLILPGSVGMALQLAQSSAGAVETTSGTDVGLPTILLVSGPQATGRSDLVKRLLAEGEGRFVEPRQIDPVSDPATYERLAQRGELLTEGKYGITKEGLLSSAAAAAQNQSVVIVDASVDLSKKLTRIPGLRIIGVWVGLNSVDEFEKRLGDAIDSGDIVIDEEETRESTIRNKIREVVKEVEYGISSGVFEFTVLNENEESSLQQLKEAAAYCFK